MAGLSGFSQAVVVRWTVCLFYPALAPMLLWAALSSWLAWCTRPPRPPQHAVSSTVQIILPVGGIVSCECRPIPATLASRSPLKVVACLRRCLHLSLVDGDALPLTVCPSLSFSHTLSLSLPKTVNSLAFLCFFPVIDVSHFSIFLSFLSPILHCPQMNSTNSP